MQSQRAFGDTVKSYKEGVSYRRVLGQVPDTSPGVKNNNYSNNNLFWNEFLNFIWKPIVIRTLLLILDMHQRLTGMRCQGWVSMLSAGWFSH